MPNAYSFIRTLFLINGALLCFNLLPVYPLDGGQILQALLWFVFGRARSLMITTVVGFIGGVGLILLAIRVSDLWFGILCVFILINCWRGLTQARVLARAHAGARAGAGGQAAAPGRVRLPLLQTTADPWPDLAVRPVRAAVRHF